MGPPPAFDMHSLALHHERLRHFVTALVGDEHAADDALQDVWMRAMHDGPREPGALGSWLRTTARRVVQNHRRGAARRRFREHRAARGESLPSSSELAERVELQRKVLDVLERLAEPHRSLLRDHYFGGLTVAEIARRAGANVHTVKDRLQRARVAMRRALERAGLGETNTFRWALAGAVPCKLPGPMLLGSSLVMKKIALVAAAVVVTAAMLVWRWSDPGAARIDDSLAVATQTPEELAALAVDAPEQETARTDVTATPATDEATSPADLDWIVRGRVVFSDGATGELPIVRLRLTARDGYESTGAPFSSIEVESTAHGTFEWALPDPSRTVSITAELFDVAGHSARVTEHVQAVVGEGPPEDFVVYVAPRDAWVEGHVLASARAPVPNAPIEGARIVYNEAHTVSDSRGAYRLAVPSRGYGSLIATAEGYRRGGDSPGGLRRGGTSEIDIVLEPELGPEGDVYGLVRDDRGAVLANAVVRCGSAREREVRTDVTGRYELHGVALQRDSWIAVVASCDGYASREELVRIARGAVMPPNGTQLDFTLVRGTRVVGRVTDADGEVVRGARVWMGPDAQLVANRKAYSNDDGIFVFENVTPGKTLLGVRKTGHPESVQELTVPADGSRVELTIGLERASTLRGRVTDAVGLPVPDAVVRARRGSESPLGRARELGSTGKTDAEGRFEIRGLPEGPLEIIVLRRGILRRSIAHEHDGGLVEVTVERARRIAGRVVDKVTGDPVEQFVVRLDHPQDEALGPWFSGIDISWVMGGRSFGAVDGRWSSDEKDPIRGGVWTFVEVEAEGYEVARIGPVQVAAEGEPDEWVHELVRR